MKFGKLCSKLPNLQQIFQLKKTILGVKKKAKNGAKNGEKDGKTRMAGHGQNNETSSMFTRFDDISTPALVEKLRDVFRQCLWDVQIVEAHTTELEAFVNQNVVNRVIGMLAIEGSRWGSVEGTH